MNSWAIDKPGSEARRKATRAFCEYMDSNEAQNVADRALCTKVPPTEAGLTRARELWAKLGDFFLAENGTPPKDVIAIPKTTVIRVYELTERDDLVTIVLPEKNGLPPASQFEPVDYYRCTYWPYIP
ncbi:MAG TPA: hypothetical protein VGW57_16325 [Chthoniobacterales bacterium]|nr:hypothetical protein [Chthoniobacterales bacterium]